jgi:hypothetical protein
MNTAAFNAWLAHLSLPAIAGLLFLCMLVAAVVGFSLRSRHQKADLKTGRKDETEGQEGYVVSAVLGLLALLMGFTFSLAVDRFDTRRARVLEEANAIGTTYLRTQLLAEPDRQRISGLLVNYVDNRIALANASPTDIPQRLQTNDQLLTDLWAATSAAFDNIKGLDFSSAYIDSMNALIDMDAARKAARQAHVPDEIFVVLFIYLVVTCGVMGYVLTGSRGRVAAGFLLVLLTMSFTLILDIDHPNLGGVREKQGPMEDLKASLAAQPPAVFDHWKVAPAKL